MHSVARRAGFTVLAAFLLAAPFMSCASRGALAARGESSPSPYLAQFDSLWRAFDQTYPSFEYKGVDWKAQGLLYRQRAQQARSQAELIAIASEMLAPLHDLHVWFIDPRGQMIPTFRPEHVTNFDGDRWQRALKDAGLVRKVGDIAEGTVGGYGYLFLNSWNISGDVSALDLMLTRVRETSGLIIDVRTNGGGSDATAMAFASRFTARSFAASYVQVRNGPRYEDLDVPTARTVAPRGAWQYLRPVVLITGRGGFSATESFVAAMRTLPNVTVIGDTTGGASGNPVTYPLGGGWSFTVPRWIEYGPDRQPIEGRGVAPHLALAWEPSQYDRDRDPLIDAAVGVLAERNGVFRVAPAGDDEMPDTTGSVGSSRGRIRHR